MLSLLLPDRCAGCDAEGDAFCARCRTALRRLRPPLCERCGAPVAYPVRRCRECAGRRLAYAAARSAVAYEGVAVSLVRAWKEHGRRRLAAVAAALVAEVVAPPEADALVFVPAVSERELWRGDNPARALARGLAAAWGLPLAAPVARRSFAGRQRSLDRATRRRNVAGAFVAIDAAPRRICLVDDVLTTGATADATARALRRAGARRVEVVTFARALRP